MIYGHDLIKILKQQPPRRRYWKEIVLIVVALTITGILFWIGATV
jgi:hypothetical protein